MHRRLRKKCYGHAQVQTNQNNASVIHNPINTDTFHRSLQLVGALVARSDCRQLSKIVNIVKKIIFTLSKYYHMIVDHLMFKLHGKFYLKMFYHSMVKCDFVKPCCAKNPTWNKENHENDDLKTCLIETKMHCVKWKRTGCYVFNCCAVFFWRMNSTLCQLISKGYYVKIATDPDIFVWPNSTFLEGKPSLHCIENKPWGILLKAQLFLKIGDKT